MAEGIRCLGLPPDEAAVLRLCRYYDELGKWSRKINLVADAPRLEQLETHFLDSLTLWPLIAELLADSGAGGPPPSPGSANPVTLPGNAAGDRLRPDLPENPAPAGLELLDIGSGAGFPGLVLKCWRPQELAVTLVEPRLKRVSFLRQVIRTLQLDGIRVLPQRLEPGEPPPGNFPLITSRAFTAIAPFLELCATLSPPGGRVICMKGPRAEAELAGWRREQPASPFRLEQVVRLTLPFSQAQRNLLLFRRGG